MCMRARVWLWVGVGVCGLWKVATECSRKSVGLVDFSLCREKTKSLTCKIGNKLTEIVK